MPPQKKQRCTQMAAIQISEGEGACDTLDDSMDLDCLLEDVECQWYPEVVPARTLSGIFMVGSCPLTSYEQDLRYAYARQQVYLIRNVSLAGLCVPSACKAEALAQPGVSCNDFCPFFRKTLEFAGIKILLCPVFRCSDRNASPLVLGILATWRVSCAAPCNFPGPRAHWQESSALLMRSFAFPLARCR